MAKVIIYGPQGCGKTRNAKALAEFFGCDKIQDLGGIFTIDRLFEIEDGTLVLTDFKVFWPIPGCYAFDEAMRLMNGKSVTDSKFKCDADNNIIVSGVNGDAVEVKMTPVDMVKTTLDNYLAFASEESAKEFNKIRKQLAIQFEFKRQHQTNPALHCEYFPMYHSSHDAWVSEFVNSMIRSPMVRMTKDVCDKFCEMANNDLIEGLEIL